MTTETGHLLCISILLFVVTISIGKSIHENYTSNDISDNEDQFEDCRRYLKNFNVSNDDIPEQEFANCTIDNFESDDFHLKCVDGIEQKWLNVPSCRVRVLTLISWPESSFPTEYVLRYFPLLTKLNIINSTFSVFAENFPSSSHLLEKITLYGLKNVTIEKNLFSQLPGLKILDLKNNTLGVIHPDTISEIRKLSKIYLRNNLWNCSDYNLQWLAHLNSTSAIIAKSKIADYTKLTCEGDMYPRKPLHIVMDLIKKIHDNCPEECSCVLSNLVQTPIPNTELVPVSTVDCQSRGLTVMPSKLPDFTTILLLQRNNISDINPLIQNIYKNVVDVHLDYNRLTNVRALEGSDWLRSFRVLSISGNNISKLPSYAFNSAFEHNPNLVRVNFGKNPWRCDCVFTLGFQELISKYNKIIGDLNDIRCEESEVIEKSKIKIITLSRGVICQPAEELLINAVDVLNIILATMIMLVLGKFGYDYYWFKKSGKLPWIATKIP